jgi:hypothetical protein
VRNQDFFIQTLTSEVDRFRNVIGALPDGPPIVRIDSAGERDGSAR